LHWRKIGQISGKISIKSISDTPSFRSKLAHATAPILLSEEKGKVYALRVDDRDRATWGVIDGKRRKSQAAVEGTAKLFEPKA
jgi:hypothetical protein